MTTLNNNQPKGDEVKLTTVQKAVLANIPAKSAVTVGGTSYTQAQIVALITNLLVPYSAARVAKQASTAAVQAKQKNEPAVKTFLVEFRAAMIALFGRSSPILAQFGFNPTKAKSTTSGKNVVKAAKAKATRAKLGTKGPLQKAEILADSPAFTVSPTGDLSLVDASSNAPATAANTPATTANGASGSNNPGSPAGSSTAPSGS
jgi:hypothetical protein